MITGTHHTALRARDFDRSVAFYQDVLGLSPHLGWTMDNGKRALMLRMSDLTHIEIFERPEGNAVTEEPVLLHVALRTNDLDGDLDRVRAAGCEVTMQRTELSLQNTVTTADAAPGEVPVRIAFFKGPDGELIELFDNDAT